MNFLSKPFALLAKTSAHSPIHVIIVTALVTAFAYLSIVDDFINVDSNTSTKSYYHPPSKSKSSDFSEWSLISDLGMYKDCDHYAITPIQFKRVNQRSVPTNIPNTFYTNDNTEQFLQCSFDNLTQETQSLRTIVSDDGTVWKFVHQYKFSRYQSYLKSAYNKFKSVLLGAETFDIVMVSMAYVAMYYTMGKLFYDMKSQTGSKFWLAFAALTSSTFAFILAYAVTLSIFKIQVSLLSLSEGLPFLVATIGFNKVVRFSKLILSEVSADHGARSVSSVVYNSLSENGFYFIKDQILCASAFFACAAYAPHLQGLRNFCFLSGLILVFDTLLGFTYYSAVLALKVEINMIHYSTAYKEALREDGVSETAAFKSVWESEKHTKEEVFLNNNTLVLVFKVAVIVSFLALHAYIIGSNWVDGAFTSSESWIKPESYQLSKTIAKHIVVNSGKGTIVTIFEPKIYMPKTFVFQFEDFFLNALEKVSLAIRDRFISKTLLFFLGISCAINIYLLNVARVHSIDKPSAIHEKNVQIVEQNEKMNELIKSKAAKTTHVDDAQESSRSFEECVQVLQYGDLKSLKNEEVSQLVVGGKLPLYALEKKLGDTTRAVVVRRKALAKIIGSPVLDSASVPYEHYDYDRVFGACCENVVGYIPLPLGMAGPILIDGKPYHIPMATTEGCLVASAMRGCKAINLGGGVTTILTRDGMTRGPCVRFASLKRAGACKIWLDSEEGQAQLKKAFNSTSRFARLQHVQVAIAGSLLYIRFRTTTGDAMGMNMISKGVEFTLKKMQTDFGWEDMEVISVSGNYCTDKKAAAVNWINGRGKSVVAEATIPADVVKKVLKSDVDSLVDLNISKNLIGSAMAGSIGGFNAQSANLVTAVFLACGQDPAQNVESSNCITLIDKVGDDLRISVSMPSIEVGTIGGGTVLEPQGAMLELLGVKGPHPTSPGSNAQQLAKIVASAVLSAELSLCSALAAGHLVQSHMQHNRAPKK